MTEAPEKELRRWLAELNAAKLTISQAAKAIGVDRAVLDRVIQDPNADTSWIVGHDIGELHNIICRNQSQWTQMIDDLLTWGYPYSAIAAKCSMEPAGVASLHNSQTQRPFWRTGERLRRLHDKVRIERAEAEAVRKKGY